MAGKILVSESSLKNYNNGNNSLKEFMLMFLQYKIKSIILFFFFTWSIYVTVSNPTEKEKIKSLKMNKNIDINIYNNIKSTNLCVDDQEIQQEEKLKTIKQKIHKKKWDD